MSAQHNGSSGPSQSGHGHTRTDRQGMQAAARELDSVADQLEAYLSDAFNENLNGPGPDPISRQVARVISGRLDDQRVAVAQLAAIFRQHATAVRKQLGTTDEGESGLASTLR